jgi:beta-lactam-binding protein with PASTA domain
MIFVLSAMIGYLYWQQTRLHQNLQSLGLVVSTLVNRSHEVQEEVVEEVVAEPVAEPVPEPEQEVDVPVAKVEEDDRVSVEHVTSAAPSKEVDLDDLDGKTKKQLQVILDEKGLPYNKTSTKTELIQLLKATA